MGNPFTLTPVKIGDFSLAAFRVMLADFGVPITVGVTAAQALVAVDGQVIEGEAGFAGGLGAGTEKRGEVIGEQITATVVTTDFPEGALMSDTPMTIDAGDFAGSYVIRQRIRQAHAGLNLSKLFLRRQ